jgi:hypothetical protein
MSEPVGECSAFAGVSRGATNDQLTDRRRKRALAANPAFEKRSASESKERNSGSVERIVRLQV